MLTGEYARRNQRLLKKLTVSEKVKKQIDQLRDNLKGDNTVFQQIETDQIKLIDFDTDLDNIQSGYNLRPRK